MFDIKEQGNEWIRQRKVRLREREREWFGK